jgi:hypothetical protein
LNRKYSGSYYFSTTEAHLQADDEEIIQLAVDSGYILADDAAQIVDVIEMAADEFLDTTGRTE